MKSRALKGIALLAISLLFSLIGFFCWLTLKWRQSLEPVVSLEKYEKIVSARKASSSRYSFLPATVHENAQDTAFVHIPGFLQGGDVISLRQRLPKQDITQLLDYLEQSRRVEIREFENISAPLCYPRYGIKKPSTDHPFQDFSELPEGFRIFLFEGTSKYLILPLACPFFPLALSETNPRYHKG